MAFKDHFSSHATAYAAARPRYPRELFTWIASLAPRRRLAWDCGTGNGQAAAAMARRFARVVASDASAEQIAEAAAHPRVAFRVAPAERSGLARESVDVICVAQALHWFDLARFWVEARRVLVPGGVIAAWCYGLLRVDQNADAVIAGFHAEIAAHWPPERRLVETGYRALRFPFREIAPRTFAMTATWTVDDLLAYLDTWSAVRRFRAGTGTDPLRDLIPRLTAVWPRGERRLVRWPLAMRVGVAG